MHVGFLNMQDQKIKTRKEVEKKEKSEPKATKSIFPKPPEGTYWNPFGLPLQDMDIYYGFEQVDTKMDNRITFDEFQAVLKKIDMTKGHLEAQSMFEALDLHGEHYVFSHKYKQNAQNTFIFVCVCVYVYVCVCVCVCVLFF